MIILIFCPAAICVLVMGSKRLHSEAEELPKEEKPKFRFFAKAFTVVYVFGTLITIELAMITSYLLETSMHLPK